MRAQTFERIYERNEWNGTETPSGPGSSLAATRHLQEELPKLCTELGVTSVLDAACGDSYWMPDLPGYIGIDIVPEAVAKAKKRNPERDYRVADICSDVLPKCDLVICRDAMQHLSLRDCLEAVGNFYFAEAAWLLATTTPGVENIDIPTGGWFEINLAAEPFYIGEPERLIPDGVWDSGVKWPNKFLGLFEL